MADEVGSGPPLDDLTGLTAFITDLIQGSPFPSLGPNDPPEWRRERARGQLMDAASRAVYGKSMGEIQPTDILATILSMVPAGRFAPTAAQGAGGAIEAGVGAAGASDLSGLVRRVFDALRNPIPMLPTHAKGSWRDLALYGRFPARRAAALIGLLEHLIEAALAASPENAPPGSVNPAAMP